MSQLYDGPGVRQAADQWSRLTAAGILLLAAVLCALLLLADPERGILKRNLPPADMPWSGYGISEVYITSDGSWVITRREYADRVQRYMIDAAGNLGTLRESIRPYQGADVSGSFNSTRQVTAAGNTIRVTSKKGTGYRKWMISLRDTALADYLNPLPDGQGPEMSESKRAGRRTEQEASLDAMPSGVTVVFNQRFRLLPIDVLPGHWYFETYDEACFVEPFIYLTTDRQRRLHRLRLVETGDSPKVIVDKTVALDLPGGLAERRCRVLRDPLRGLCILRADGSRYWFDADSLEITTTDRVPGDWEPEYASFDLRSGRHNAVLGVPLTELEYQRIRRGLMLGFLASLLGLALLWRPQWKSTSAATTADSNSSAG